MTKDILTGQSINCCMKASLTFLDPAVKGQIVCCKNKNAVNLIHFGTAKKEECSDSVKIQVNYF